MKDLNADAGNGWPPFYISKTLSEHFYNGCLLSSLNGYSEYDKEMLKRTMLEHESIFRKQVYELHRLYSIQKDLMIEFQKSGSSGFFKHEGPPKTSSYTSQIQSEYATRMFQISHLHAMNDSQEKEKARYNVDNISPINFLERNQQSSCGYLETEALQRDAEPDASFRLCPKTMLDLQLPACGHDGTERSKEAFPGSSPNTFTSSRICKGDSEIKLKLNLSSDSGSMGKDVCKLNYHPTKNLFTSLADSIESNEHSFLEGASDSFPVQVFGQRTQKEDNHGFNFFSLSLTKLSLQNAFPKGRDCHDRAFSNGFQETKDETYTGTVCSDEPGKSDPISHKGKYSMLSEPIKVDVNNASGIISSDHNAASTRFTHEEGAFQFRHSDIGKLPSVVPNSFSTSLNLDSNVTSSPCPNWMKLSGNWQVGSNLRSPLRFEDHLSHPNGLNDGFLFHSHSTLHDSQKLKFPFINKNINVDSEIPFSGIQNRLTTQQNKAASSMFGKSEEPSRLPSHLDLLSEKIDRVYEWKTENAKSLPSCHLEVLSSSLQKGESKIKINPLSDSLSTANFIDSNFENNLASSSNEENLVTDNVKRVSMSYDIKKCSSERSTSAENNTRNSRNYIDLNSVLPITDDPDSSDSLTEVQAEFPSNHLDPNPVPGIVTLIDLEEPVNITSMRLQEELCSHEMLIKEAAENIVRLSLDEFKHKDVIRGSSLYLFAEMILSNQNIIRSNEPLCNGFDLFELMTLQLEETTPEKLWCKTREVENTVLDKWSKASILLAKPRKAQGRKRRQRKDFQKDILPSLATLSKRETIEDLRIIEELMKASGLSWQVGLGRRKARRIGAQRRANEKRRRINASAPIVQINPPTSFSVADDNDNPDFEVDRHDMIGWGRTTRRCRSQRSHPTSISTSLM